VAKSWLTASFSVTTLAFAGVALTIALKPTPAINRVEPAADPPPGGRAADVAAARDHPEAFAWRVFDYLDRQAEPGAAGLAHPARPIGRYDEDAPVVWETWALVSGARASQAGSEVFRADGADPGPWGGWPRARGAPKLMATRLAFPHETPSSEIRINRAGYDFIRSRALYNLDGVRAAVSAALSPAAPRPVAFPTATQEIKARWRDLGASPAPPVLASYHWRRISGRYWGLAALHLTTKDLRDWFWADFEHIDGAGSSGRPELAGTKWDHYRLEGVQTGFTDARGAPTVLASPVIEAGFQHTSCITCHARAAAGFADGSLRHPRAESFNVDRGGAPPAVPDSANPDLGAPAPALFGRPPVFAQTDFVWSIALRAKPRRAPVTAPARPGS
jgi:hypothetical protein